MKYKLVKLDNQQSAGQSLIGEIHTISIKDGRFHFGSLVSSPIENIDAKSSEHRVIIKTKNSTYTFEVQVDN